MTSPVPPLSTASSAAAIAHEPLPRWSQCLLACPSRFAPGSERTGHRFARQRFVLFITEPVNILGSTWADQCIDKSTQRRFLRIAEHEIAGIRPQAVALQDVSRKIHDRAHFLGDGEHPAGHGGDWHDAPPCCRRRMSLDETAPCLHYHFWRHARSRKFLCIFRCAICRGPTHATVVGPMAALGAVCGLSVFGMARLEIGPTRPAYRGTIAPRAGIE